MKLNLKVNLTVVTILFTLLLFSCTQEEVIQLEEEVTADMETIDQLVKVFDNTLDIAHSSKKHLSEKEFSKIFSRELQNSSLSTKMGPTLAGAGGNSSQYSAIANQIDDSHLFNSKSAYVRHLRSLNTATLTSSISRQEKQDLVDRIAFMEAFVDWMEAESHTVVLSGGLKCDGWWKCWGKCAAGIVGGAGVAGLGGAFLGGAGCTMVVPIIGTVACGVVGGIAGAVFGGLGGAAAAC